KASLSPSRKRTLAKSSGEPASKKTKDTLSTPPTKLSPTVERFPSPPDQPATQRDQEIWQGFCEIESEPGYFSVMLREMGVKDVTVRDVFHLDFLADIPKPIYGLILLFRARQVNSEGQEEECPPNVWFANQLPGQNSCATVAMINTLMNHDSVDIGEHLHQFKVFTADFTPYQRGEALASFDFVKKIHNSFAKKMDILENDKQLAYKVSKSERKKNNGLKAMSSRQGSEDSNSSTCSFEDSAHHFIAFVPIDDEIWKLDGMDEQPTLMGAYTTTGTDDWVTVASKQIQTIMDAGDHDYNIIAIAQAPLARLRREMCTNVTTFNHAKKRIATLNADWSSFLPAPEPGVNVAEPVSPKMLNSIGVFEKMLEEATVPADVSKQIETEEFPALLERCGDLCGEQISLRDQIFAEMTNEQEENDKARERRTDLGPLIKKWCEMLAENGFLEQHLEKYMPEEPKK
ncbi:cysteine proteinase, partial [Melanomma pulvis-pyrius CBS 109.77]